MIKKSILEPVIFATTTLVLFCLCLASITSSTRGANQPPTLNPITNRTLLCGASLVVSNTASDAETPLNQLIYSLANPLCVTSSLPMATYNIGPGLQAWRSHLEDSNAINVVLIGESTTEGLTASDINATSYAAILRRRLQNVLGDGGLGLIPLYRELPPFTSYWDTQGTWSQGRFDEYGPFSFTFFGSGAQSYTEITIYGDNVDVYLVLSSFGTNGPTGAYWQVDGGAANYFNSYAPDYAQSTLNIPLGAIGWHTLRLTCPSAPGKSFGLWGASANLGQRGVRVHNIGKNGVRIAETTQPNALQFLGRINPALTVIAFSSNDYAMQTDTNSFRNDVLALIQAAKQTGSVLLLGSNPRRADMPTPIPQSAYHDILKALAFSQNCAFIDMNERWGNDPTNARALGFTIDMVHPTDLGYADMGNLLYCQVAEQPAAETFFSSALEPDGLYINGHTGALKWTPTTNQCPSVNNVGVIVKDNGSPALTATQSFVITVTLTNGGAANTPPMLAALTNQSILVGNTAAFTAMGTDSDVPANTLAYSLSNAPAGAVIHGTNGTFAWTPTAGQLGAFTFNVVVNDNGVPPLSASRPITITVGALPVALIAVTNTTATIIWNSLPGVTYHLAYKTALTDAAWSPVPGNILASGATSSKTDNFGSAPRRFYRVFSP